MIWILVFYVLFMKQLVFRRPFCSWYCTVYETRGVGDRGRAGNVFLSKKKAVMTAFCFSIVRCFTVISCILFCCFMRSLIAVYGYVDLFWVLNCIVFPLHLHIAGGFSHLLIWLISCVTVLRHDAFLIGEYHRGRGRGGDDLCDENRKVSERDGRVCGYNTYETRRSFYSLLQDYLTNSAPAWPLFGAMPARV